MKKTQRLTFAAMIIAIILLMAFVPFLGFIQLGIFSVTIIHIPTLVGALTFNDRNLALISGATFGISSWLISILRPAAITDIVFQNPLVSILPRILFALIAFYLFKRLNEIIENKSLSLVLSSAIATFLHTVMVLGMMYIFANDSFPDGFIPVLLTALSGNGIFEIIVATVVVAPIVIVLQKTFKIS